MTRRALASPAMWHRGPCPLDFQLFNFWFWACPRRSWSLWMSESGKAEEEMDKDHLTTRPHQPEPHTSGVSGRTGLRRLEKKKLCGWPLTWGIHSLEETERDSHCHCDIKINWKNSKHTSQTIFSPVNLYYQKYGLNLKKIIDVKKRFYFTFPTFFY